MKDDEVYGVEGTSYTAEYWQYDSRLGRRWNLDPIDQVSISNYACFYNNPISIYDVKGNKGESTHIDEDGKVIGVYEDGDYGVYMHKNEELDKFGFDRADPVRMAPFISLSKEGDQKVGVTLTPLGFADFRLYEQRGTVVPAKGARIDLNSTYAQDQFTRFMEEDPDLATYGVNARTGGRLDVKHPSNLPPQAERNPSFGSQLGTYQNGNGSSVNIYASARDVGNMMAGYASSSSILPDWVADYGYGRYNEQSNSAGWLIITVARDMYLTFGPATVGLGVTLIQDTKNNGEDKLTVAGFAAGRHIFHMTHTNR